MIGNKEIQIPIIVDITERHLPAGSRIPREQISRAVIKVTITSIDEYPVAGKETVRDDEVEITVQVHIPEGGAVRRVIVLRDLYPADIRKKPVTIIYHQLVTISEQVVRHIDIDIEIGVYIGTDYTGTVVPTGGKLIICASKISVSIIQSQ